MFELTNVLNVQLPIKAEMVRESGTEVVNFRVVQGRYLNPQESAKKWIII
jgi:hypothetical protein